MTSMCSLISAVSTVPVSDSVTYTRLLRSSKAMFVVESPLGDSRQRIGCP